MRSDLNPAPSDESGRVIDLGAVRRRRSRRRSPDGLYLVVLGLLAVFFWVIWLAVLFNLYPSKLLTYLAFLIPLFGAVASTGAFGAYLFEARRSGIADIGMAVRRGAIIASVVIVNLGFQFAHRWTWPVAVVSVLVGAAAEAAADHRAA